MAQEYKYFIYGNGDISRYMREIFLFLGISKGIHSINGCSGILIIRNNYITNPREIAGALNSTQSCIWMEGHPFPLCHSKRNASDVPPERLNLAFIAPDDMGFLDLDLANGRFKGFSQSIGGKAALWDTNLCAGLGVRAKSQDAIAKFVLGTKFETLNNLKPILKKSKILELLKLSHGQWRVELPAVREKILNTFNTNFVIVRSSSSQEDSWSASNAGVFQTIMYVNAEIELELSDAIFDVFKSYGKNCQHGDHVLIQPMLDDVKLSGVALSRNLSHHSPYYVINYDDSQGGTDSITSGNDSGKTLVIRRDFDIESSAIPIEILAILDAIKEIESIIECQALDVEFAVDKNDVVYIFQVRPIAGVDALNFSDAKIFTRLDLAKSSIQNLKSTASNMLGEDSIFGVMPDAHPAELIGLKPKPLAYSLYRHFITDDVFASQRSRLGYRDVRPNPLMIELCGQPFVDVRTSFNSMMPNALRADIASKIINCNISKLKENYALHDKVEFDILLTNWIFNIESAVVQRYSKALTPPECDEYVDALILLTNTIIKNFNDDTKVDVSCLDKFDPIINSGAPNLKKASYLINAAKNYGVESFVLTARCAFIATSILRSFVSGGIVSQGQYDLFMRSLNTVTFDMERDAFLVKNGDMEINSFAKKYGHLRPGTYDITVPAYFQKIKNSIAPIIESSREMESIKCEWPDSVKKKIDDIFYFNGLHITYDQFEKFCRRAIAGRENRKFEYTKLLSYGLFYLEQWGLEVGLSVDQLSFLNWPMLNDLALGCKEFARSDVLAVADIEMNKFMANTGIELPLIFSSAGEIDYFFKINGEANFITTKNIEAKILAVNVEHPSQDLLKEIYGKIVLIPRADPGYDWLFSQGIAGLITMFGGGNSHMAIRSAELGLPAAIGVGENLYNKYATANRMALNCLERKITISSN